MTAPAADPMEDFLAREKAALEALEAVEIENGDAMQVDEPIEAPNHVSHPASPPAIIKEVVVTNNSSTLSTPRVTSPTTPRTRVETPIMKEWKARRATQIAERDAAATQVARERASAAKRDVETWRAQYKESLEGRKSDNRRKGKESKGLSEWDEEKPVKGELKKEQVDWKGVLGLIDSLPRPSKDTSRLLGIIKSLAE